MSGANEKEKAENFILWIEELGVAMDIPKGFDCIRREDIGQMISWARREAHPLYPVPVIWDENDFRALIDSVDLNAEKSKPRPAAKKSALYIYKPYENAMAWRVEFRGEAAYIYSGWSKNWLYRMEEDKIYAAGKEEASYITIGNKVFDASGEKILYRIEGENIYKGSERAASLVIKSSIRVQGTI